MTWLIALSLLTLAIAGGVLLVISGYHARYAVPPGMRGEHGTARLSLGIVLLSLVGATVLLTAIGYFLLEAWASGLR